MGHKKGWHSAHHLLPSADEQSEQEFEVVLSNGTVVTATWSPILIKGPFNYRARWMRNDREIKIEEWRSK